MFNVRSPLSYDDGLESLSAASPSYSSAPVAKQGTKILFIHGNYPGQFRHLASYYGNNPDCEVRFLTKEDYPNKWAIKGVAVSTFRLHREVSPNTHPYLNSTEDGVLKGQAVVREVHKMMASGFVPDLVVFHAGMGLGLFLRDLLPDARLLGYFEWYFTPATAQYLFPAFSFDVQLRSSVRNLLIEHELTHCDLGIVPTQWQYAQFPRLLQSRLQVVFDGIDTSFFQLPPTDLPRSCEFPRVGEGVQPLSLSDSDLVLSYATRGMEPLRGFPQFMRALPYLLPRLPRLHVLIAGEDRQAYSYAAPTHEGSWKKALLDEIGSFPGSQRICFTGSLTYNDYRRLLWRSDMHCYFTFPYVISWSLFESVACGTKLCLSTNGATDLFLEYASVKIDLASSPKQIAAALYRALAQERAFKIQTQKTQLSTRHFPDDFKLSVCMRRWISIVDQLINNG
jgi:glycosyltransferase involved in cell wall biosynthesis